MEITYTEKFYKQLSKLPTRTQLAVRDVLVKLEGAKNLESSGVDYALLKGGGTGNKYYRIRVGEYRIGIRYIHPDVIVVVVARRGEIYKAFPPK